VYIYIYIYTYIYDGWKNDNFFLNKELIITVVIVAVEEKERREELEKLVCYLVSFMEYQAQPFAFPFTISSLKQSR
jgi:hypothetical protein